MRNGKQQQHSMSECGELRGLPQRGRSETADHSPASVLTHEHQKTCTNAQGGIERDKRGPVERLAMFYIRHNI